MVILCHVELDIKIMYEAQLLHAPMECGLQCSLFAFSKKVNTKVPIQVEAKSFLWAMELADQKQLQNVVIEGNSKLCAEVVTNRSKLVHQRTVNFVVEVKLLYARFDRLEFNWVYRNANKATRLSKMVFVNLFSKLFW